MASIFGHAVAGLAIGWNTKTKNTLKYLLLLVFCAVIPDIDVIAFKFGIPYESVWGHRGFTHSIFFAFLLGFILALVFERENKFYFHFFIYTLATLSHPILDGLTTGGLGCGYFIPFNNQRYFFPWQVIKVSPIGIKNFFSEWGAKVIISEFYWIGIPSIFILIMKLVSHKINSLKK